MRPGGSDLVVTRVSVLMLSFNHGPYVEQAVESFLSQELDPAVEARLIIGDDCSTDGSPEILRRLASENADRVSLVDRSVNIGMFKNLADLWERADGDYVAM